MEREKQHRIGRIGIPLGFIAGMVGVLSSEVRGHPLEQWPRLVLPYLPAIVISTLLATALFIGIRRSQQPQNKEEDPQPQPGRYR